MSFDSDLATAIASSLNAAGGDLASVTSAAKKYLPRYALTELASIKIDVAPRLRQLTTISRSSQQRIHTIQIQVIQQCQADSGLHDTLIDLVEAIDDYLASRKQAGATWMTSETNLYDFDDLDTKQVFKSILTLTYMRIA